MSWLDDLRMYARFARRLPGFLATRDTPEQGRALLTERLATRAPRFLAIAERFVYGHPGSPYLPLLREAGCELGDLRAMVASDGVEGALRRLRAAGVYVRFEQLKGREPLVVAGREIPVGPESFLRPDLRPDLEGASSGSTGRRTKSPIDLDHKAARSAVSLAIAEAQGVLDLPKGRIGGSLPESTNFAGALAGSRGVNVAERWWKPELTPPRKTELRFRLAHHFVVTLARFYGVRVPKPEPLPMDQVVRVARWAAETVAARGACAVSGTPSMALRVAVAARREGIDLTGVTFTCNGEALTPAKAAGIASAGARALANYSMTEVGRVGAGCLAPIGVNEQHVMTDHLAVIQGRRTVGDREVDALLLTTLLATTPRVLLNVEIDDYGVLEERRCGCPLDALGLHLHVRDVRSFKKLTAEGVTLVGSEMEHVLEHVLPARFGGSALDYQLVEEEDEEGFTRITLRVSPSVGPVDEAALVAAVLAGLERASISADLAIRLWNQTGALRVARIEPTTGARGKLQPLRSERRSGDREAPQPAAAAR
jgi:hypothetical protein